MIRRSFYKHDVHCAADGCDVPVGRGRIYCRGHYYSLTDALRSRLWAAWRKAMGARDGTKYGSSRRSTRSYYTHHIQRISLAAVISDARNIIDQVNKLKQDVCRSQ